MSAIDYSAFGFQEAQWGHVAAGGWLAGAANLNATNTGVSSNIGRLIGVNNAAPVLSAPTITPALGNNTRIAQYLFSSTEPTSFDIQVAANSLSFATALDGVTSTAYGQGRIRFQDYEQVQLNRLFLMFTRAIIGHDSGSVGAPGWEHLILPNCQVTKIGSSWTYQGQEFETYTVLANRTDTFIDGRAITDINPTIPNGQAAQVVITTDNLLSYATLIGDNLDQDIVLAHEPVATDRCVATVQTTGFATTPVTAIATTAPFEATLTATPGTGLPAVVGYELVRFSA